MDQCWIIINNFKNNYPRCMPNDLGYKYLEPDANQGNLMQKQCLTFQFFPSSKLFSGNLRKKNLFTLFVANRFKVLNAELILKQTNPHILRPTRTMWKGSIELFCAFATMTGVQLFNNNRKRSINFTVLGAVVLAHVMLHNAENRPIRESQKIVRFYLTNYIT